MLPATPITEPHAVAEERLVLPGADAKETEVRHADSVEQILLVKPSHHIHSVDPIATSSTDPTIPQDLSPFVVDDTLVRQALANDIAIERSAIPTAVWLSPKTTTQSGIGSNIQSVVRQVGFNTVSDQMKPATETSSQAATNVVVAELPAPLLHRKPSSRRITRPARSVIQTAGEELSGKASGVVTELQPLTIPVREPTNAPRASLNKVDDLVTLVATDADLLSVLQMIAEHHELNLVVGPEVIGAVTVNIRGARLDEVLNAIVGVAGFHWHMKDHLLYVTAPQVDVMDPMIQGRRLQVYPLNYVAAKDVEPIVAGLLSPIGKSFVTQSSDTEKLQTQELLIVEDGETGHSRISQYIAQVDVPPAQVLVEAHVLQIDLDDEQRQGVDLTGLARVAGARLTLEGNGFADSEPDGPSLAFRIDGNDVDGLIEAIHSNTSSRTLASPKVSVVNRQMAKVQIGQRLPYAVATTTQTATIQNVQFLDVGIVLEVTPVITEDRYILMTVLPKISGGRITESGFPEEDTTQVSTTVLMPDGSGLVIGGLIREVDQSNEAVVPGLGKLPVIKRLFNRSTSQSRRNELVVALVTHIMDGPRPIRERECLDLQQALPPYAAKELTVR